MKLYELSMEYQKLLDQIEEADGELSPEQWDMIESVEDRFSGKVENLAKFIKSLEADADAVKVERQRLAAREKSITNKVSWLKAYLQHAMEAVGVDKIKGQLLTVALRKAPVSCIVEDADKVPDEFREEVSETKIDRNGIIRCFKETGEVLPGVEIVTDKRFVAIR